MLGDIESVFFEEAGVLRDIHGQVEHRLEGLRQDGFLFLDKDKFAASFAADVNKDEADFMASSQVPWGVGALGGAVSTPAWKTKPSWYLVATDDKMIPPPAQRAMSKRAGSTVTEVKGSHAVYVSQPEAVAKLIEQVAASVNK